MPTSSTDHAGTILTQDRAHVWHPYASTTTPGPLYVVQSAAGTRLTLDDGTTTHHVVDAMASWWCMIHGYRHPALDQALHDQVDQFSHVMFGGLTHAAGVALAQDLVDITPAPLNRVFLADSGSVAVEVALKLARQLQLTRAARRHVHGPDGSSRRAGGTRIAALRGGYHGDTLAAMSVCDPDGGMHAAFADSIPAQIFLPRPPAFDADHTHVTDWTDQARQILHTHRDDLAAVIVEPILQGAGGMWSWSPLALRALRDLTDEYELLLIADEIATGFGRTGRFFACEWADITPDILIVGKAMTGGYLTQAAVIARDEIAAEIGHGPFGALMHGPTFMANPLASAVSRASITLLRDGHWQDDVRRVGDVLRRELTGPDTPTSLDSPLVEDVRIIGASVAVALTHPVDMTLATRVAVDHGVWLRPFRNLVYAMPPYISSDDDLTTIARGIRAVVAAHEEHTR
ncbi:Adenosylmethionine-8-amino-7-oxononanoate aminotransferase [Austwickia sp. TVS 96-490-7B]|uniref:adenosylmethionine--8-amino-7-oxononanoate transaminase n=1 Tax=Austwickia sp. TVS 96-490-7B TaxID=2830843 RepID=UPI001C591805|nr:adenosylmethionine--8-amino-7-oxononanoate transaminase [Austwickia sp. TVS 96-490-7B]MBW3085269.1 Adenosylmethionine-8-amino-7-oxononanoate aminotransferase [Austwickia sp. TVS 96-490-7B]